MFTFEPVNPLPNGEYVLQLTVENDKGIEVTDTVFFKVNVSCFSIDLIDPSLGVADHEPFDLLIETNETSVCKMDIRNSRDYDSMKPFDDETGNLNHFIYSLPKTGYPVNEWYYILCKHTETQQMCSNYFYIGYETDPPVITVNAVPNPVVDGYHRHINLTVKTDQSTICNYTEICEGETEKDNFPDYHPDEFYSYKKNHSLIIDYSDDSGYFVGVTDWDRHSFSYKIECKNLADFLSYKDYEVIADIEPTSNIIMESPGRCVNTNSFVFNVSTLLEPVEDCKYTIGEQSTKNDFGYKGSDEEKYSFWDDITIEEVDNEYTVYCKFSGGPEEEKFKITLDKQSPDFNLSADQYSCSLDELNIKLGSPDEVCGIDYYNYTVTGENVSVEGKSSREDVEIDNLDLIEGYSYTVNVYAFDKAGNIAGPKQVIITASNNSIPECDKTPPKSTAYTENIEGSENKELYIVCEDKESGCADSFYYNFIPYTEQCDFNENIFSNEYYSYLPLTIEYTLKACYIVYDDAGNNNTGSLIINVKGSNKTLPQENKTCDDGKLNYHDDAWETDVDCGGPCSPCEPGQYCEEDDDCNTGNCSYGLCYGGDDSDGDGMPDWWEEKYGLDKNDPANASKDTDGDGLTDMEEYRQGTDPTDPYNGGEEPSQEYYSEEERSIIPLILLIFGLLFILGGIGFLIYSKYYLIPESKLKKQTITSGELGYRKKPETISQEDIEERREEEKLKEEQYKKSRAKKSKSRSSLLDVFRTDKKPAEKEKKEEPEKLEKEEIETPEDRGKKKKRGRKEKEGDFVDISELGKESGKEFIDIGELKKKKKSSDKDIFEQLDKLSLSSKSKKQLKDSLKDDKVGKPAISEILSSFSKADFNKDVFQNLLTELLKTNKLSYDDVSEIVFDLLDEGKIDQKLANKIFKELNLV
jgi:hypothetical protein